MEWRPIETSPKDGTVIDLFHKKYGRIFDQWWDDECWVGTGTVDGFTHWMQIIPPDCKIKK